MTLRRAGFVALEALLVLAVPLLGWVGFRTVLDTTEGRAVDPELDPAEPGYEAFVESTPVALALGVDEDGALSWVTVLALGGPGHQGGSVLFVPVGVLPPGGDVEPAVGELLDLGFDEVFTLDPARLAALVAPAAPVPLVLADDVPRFEEGEVELDAAGFVQLLLATDEEETELARLARHETVWRAWFEAVARSSDPDIVPGETASGIGRFVRGLTAGSVTYDTIPVEDGGDGSLVPDVDAARALVNDRVPFPVAAEPGGRPRVRVLDGVGADGLALQVARDAVRAGGQVTVIGNADRFDGAPSRIVYFDARMAGEAEALATALGVERVDQGDGPNPNDLVDLTVVVGSDLAGAYGLPSG